MAVLEGPASAGIWRGWERLAGGNSDQLETRSDDLRHHLRDPLQVRRLVVVLGLFIRLYRVLAYRCLYGTAPSYLAESLFRTSDVDTRCRLRSADTAMLVVPSTRRSTLGDRAFPVVSARAWNSLPSSVSNAPCHRRWRRNIASWRLHFFGRRLTMIGDRDCTAQYCCLPAATDCRRFCLFCLILYDAPAMSLTFSGPRVGPFGPTYCITLSIPCHLLDSRGEYPWLCS